MSPIRIGVVGAGVFGRRHVDTVRSVPACELVAIVDPAPEAAAWAREKDVRCFADHVKMLDEVKPDAVIIATPNSLHVPVGLTCVERRLPILVEKPIADTVEASRTLVETAKRAAVPLLVGHHRRHNPLIERAREVVRGGGIGRLTAVTVLWLLQKPDEYFDAAWRRQPGGGPLLINVIHSIDDLRWICGEIEEVHAMTSSAVRGFPVEDTAAVAFRLAGGALGTATVSDAVAAPWSWELASGENPVYPHQHENCYYFAGTEGAFALPALELWRYEGKKGWHAPLSRQKLEVVAADPQLRQLQHFCRVVRDGEAPRVSGEDAIRTLAVVHAVHEAARTGRAVVP